MKRTKLVRAKNTDERLNPTGFKSESSVLQARIIQDDFRVFWFEDAERVQHDTYTCHCEKIEDFRGNPKNTFVAVDYFVTTVPRNDNNILYTPIFVTLNKLYILFPK